MATFRFGSWPGGMREPRRRPAPAAKVDQRLDHVAMRQRLAAVLAAADRDVEHPRVVAHQPDIGAAGRRAAGRDFSCGGGHRDGRALWTARRADRGVQRTRVVSDQVAATVDHHLRRRDVRMTHGVRIVPLTVGVALVGEGVLPAQLVPVGDAEAQHEHTWTVSHGVHVGVRRRAGGAALALVEFDDRRARRLRRPVAPARAANAMTAAIRLAISDSSADAPVLPAQTRTAYGGRRWPGRTTRQSPWRACACST